MKKTSSAIDGFLDIPDLMQLYCLDRPRLKDKPIPLVIPARLRKDRASLT